MSEVTGSSDEMTVSCKMPAWTVEKMNEWRKDETGLHRMRPVSLEEYVRGALLLHCIKEMSVEEKGTWEGVERG